MSYQRRNIQYFRDRWGRLLEYHIHPAYDTPYHEYRVSRYRAQWRRIDASTVKWNIDNGRWVPMVPGELLEKGL